MKKLISLLLIICITFPLSSCTTTAPPTEPQSFAQPQAQPPTPAIPVVEIEETDGKIVILTIDASGRGISDYVNAVVGLYPDRIIHCDLPSGWNIQGGRAEGSWLERVWPLVEAEISDEQVKVIIIFTPDSRGIEVLSQVRKHRPDIFSISPFRNIYADLSPAINIHYFLGSVVQQAKLMGVETIVNYIETNQNMTRAEIFREESKRHGIQYVEVIDYQKYVALTVMPNIEEMIERYGKNTMFVATGGRFLFSTGYSLRHGAIAVLNSSPAMINILRPGPMLAEIEMSFFDVPYHHVDYDWQQERIIETLKEHNATGRFAAWRIPFNHISLAASVEYAIGYIDGKIESRADYDALYESFRRGFEILNSADTAFELIKSEEHDNVFYFLQEFVVF